MNNPFSDVRDAQPVKPLKSRLGRRLILLLILISGTITLITTLSQLYLDYNQEMDDVHKRHHEIETIHTQALAASLWDFDLVMLQQRLQGLTNLPYIDYLKVQSGNYEFSTGQPIKKNVFKNQFPLIYTDIDNNEEHNIGTLVVESDMTGIYYLLAKRFMMALALNTFKTAIVCYIILLIFHKSINTRIFAIAKYLRKYNPRHNKEPLLVHNPVFISQDNDELAVLTNEANKLTSNLSTLYQNIKQEQERLIDFTEVASDWLWETNKDMTLIYCSDDMAQALQITDNPHIALSDIPLVKPMTALLDQLTKKQSFEFLEVSFPLNEHMVFFMFHAKARYQNGKFLGYRGTAINITDLKQTQLELETLNKNLEKTVKHRTQALEDSLNKLKSAQNQLIETEKLAALGGLVAGVSHEVNTPLGIAVTASSVIEEASHSLMTAFEQQTLTTDEFSQLMEKLMGGMTLLNQNLFRAANLVKSFKQTAVDQISETRDNFNVATVLNALIASLHPLTRKVPVVPALKGDETISMNSFPGVLTQIISNLVTNSINHAFEHTEHPEITIEFHTEGSQLVVEYSDNGCGIPKNLHKKIFEPFFTTNRQKGGSGLGLNLVFNLITQKLKGKLKFESENGNGVHYTIHIPLNHKD